MDKCEHRMKIVIKVGIIFGVISTLIACSNVDKKPEKVSQAKFNVNGISIGDSVEKFEKLNKSDAYDLNITYDPKTRKIVRIKYVQENLPNDKKTQAYLVNYICDKYGRVAPCYSALSEIESNDKRFLRFFHLYRDDNETQELRARIRRTKAFSLTPDLTVEIDLMDSAYAKALREQKATASDLIDF